MAPGLRPLAALAVAAAAAVEASAPAAELPSTPLWRTPGSGAASSAAGTGFPGPGGLQEDGSARAGSQLEVAPGFPSHLDQDDEVPQASAGATASSWGVQVTLTTRDQALVLARQPQLPLLPSERQAPADVEISVDASQRFQPIVGLGAALTDASAYAIFRAPPQAQEALLRRLFGPAEEGGVRLSVLRLTVGVSDFSVSYGPHDLTYDEVADDYGLEHFSTAKDDAFLLPMVRRILAINPHITVMASPWTAPLWLKNVSGTPGKGWLRDTPEVFATYAEYLVRYLEDYNRKGVRIHYLTLQNEPGHGDCGPMPCMLMSPDQQIRLAQLVGQRLRSSGNANVSATKLLAYDHNWGPDDGPPQKRDWNDWLLVLLLAPVPVIFGICGVVAVLLWMIGRPLLRLVVPEDGSDQGEDEDDETPDPKSAVGVNGFSNGGLGHDGSDLEASDSDSEGESGRGLRGLLCGGLGFGHGVCLGGVLMFLASLASALLTAHLLRARTVSDKTLVDDLSRTFNGPNWPAAVLGSAAGPEFAGVAWHCYGGSPKVQAKLQERLAPIRQQPLEQHMTECSGGDWSGPWEGSLVWNQKVLIMQSFENHGRSVLQWNLALDENHGPHCTGGACCTTCRGVVTVPSMAGSIEDITYNVEFVGLAHHTSVLSPGAQRIFSDVPQDKKVHAIAYRNLDGSLALVVVNEDETANASIRVSSAGNSFRYILAPGVATFKW